MKDKIVTIFGSHPNVAYIFLTTTRMSLVKEIGLERKEKKIIKCILKV